MISNYAISLIRTWVPIGVGVLVSWLASLGITVDDSARTALVSGIGAVAGALYYALVRLLEQRWSWMGVLLGAPDAPQYAKASYEPKHARSPIDPAIPGDAK